MLEKAIDSGNFRKDLPEYQSLSTEAKSLIEGLLRVDPLKRLTIK